ncbi:hypothetical protein GCM10027160_53810 [Streptomyces calidiresistens]
MANPLPFERDQAGGQEKGSIFSEVSARGITWDESRNGSGGSVGPLRSTSTAWSPPPCWYAPRWNPEELREVAERIWDPSTQRGTAASALGWMWRHYDGGNPYEDFNSEEAGNGMWWGAVQNPNEPDILARGSCSNIPFWVETGEVPDVEGALSPLILAELAYERIRVPETNITLSPEREDRQVVNLPTWIWADTGDFSPVAVTASLDGWDIWATEGSGDTGDTLPTAVFDTTHDIEVMEVQAVVR